MIQPIVIGNWKMNGNLLANETLLEALLSSLEKLEDVQVAVCPPLPYLAQVAQHLKDNPVALGAQTLNEHEAGAHTGEVSAAMLKDLGCQYVLVGHSERRSLYGESDIAVTAKFAAAQAAGLAPVLCVGETLAERNCGDTEAVVARQLQAVVDTLGIEALSGGVIAYEPVWAIGTGETATPDQAQAVHAFIREWLARHSAPLAARLPLLYGGSVKADNAAALFAQPDIDGGLIGGASLSPNSFANICRAAEHR
ncbi:triose-phosphate isomerase [Halomonas sp. A40-4]|uniref:triose-phosphate isomerase n=1 Tax=Halomonas sp. A40-4 TaxID=2785909 RepID=UPI001937EA98|nr:triose-phosphate isomerase [Halomonas sp. A40-4]QPL47547.1 triose-phosphate isomerase [Halomonas sp. A40-4]